MERAAPVIAFPSRPPPPAPKDEIEAAFRLYSGYVASIALKLLGRKDDVDDVVQEVFLAALKGMSNLRDPKATKAWLATVTARTVAHRLRMRRLRSFFGLEKNTNYAGLAVGATQEQSVLVSRVYQILDELPVKDRIAWALRNVEGEPLDAVAAICGCSLATAKRRISAAQEAIEKQVRS